MLLLVFFAFIYWMLPASTFTKELSFIQSIYLSVITITTTGYGDITPKNDIGMLSVSLEAIFGILIIGFFINSVWKNLLDKIEMDQRAKIKESLQESNKNNLASYYAYLSSVLLTYKNAAINVTTPLANRHLKHNFDYSFKFSDLQDIFGPSLLLKHSFDMSVIEIYFDAERELVAELKYLLANFGLEDFKGIRDGIINFLNIGHLSNLRDVLCSYAKYPQGHVQRKILEDMIKQFDALPPPEYHQSNVITPVIFLYQSLPVKIQILEKIENEFEKIII